MFETDLKNGKVVIFCDGACIGNPGRGGYGTVLLYQHNGELLTKEYSGGYRLTTNNRMELLGAIVGLENIKKKVPISIYTDSRYVSDTINKKWKRKANHDLWGRLDGLLKEFEVSFHWVKGHAGNHYNEICDTLAVDAANSNQLMEDDGYDRDR